MERINVGLPLTYYVTLLLILMNVPSLVHTEEGGYLIVLVNARHLDYSNLANLCRTVAKHPSDGSKNGDVGHAWIYLHYHRLGQSFHLEGGHSGETGNLQPRYCDGLMDLVDRGDDNPVRYLWAIQKDGFFQEGDGGHRPTYAIKIDLTSVQVDDILSFIDNYPFAPYAITGNQCTTFAIGVAACAGVELEHLESIQVSSSFTFRLRELLLWQDPSYSKLIVGSPDRLETSLKRVVKEGRAKSVLPEMVRRWWQKRGMRYPWPAPSHAFRGRHRR